ncbi:MAG: hypothetical protein EU540_05490 [Promethearchaeota archaeon]|nr:MAG: hypothetical protein EU540_05490 [Candidatus Lokiarchaeota archaeon]
MKQTESRREFEELGREKLNLFSSEALDNSIKNLTRPSFLGSIHMKKMYPNTNFSSIENILKGQLELKINKSLKNAVLNPITKGLIILMVVFNIVWIMLLFLF